MGEELSVCVCGVEKRTGCVGLCVDIVNHCVDFVVVIVVVSYECISYIFLCVLYVVSSRMFFFFFSFSLLF